MTLIDRHRISVLFSDVQKRLLPEVELDDLVASMRERLMTWLGDQQVDVVVTEHCRDRLSKTVFEVPKTTAHLDKTVLSALKEHSVRVVAPQRQVVVWDGVSCKCVFDGDGSIECRAAAVCLAILWLS